MTHPGRPSEYKEEYCQKADEYLELCKDEEIKVLKQKNEDKGYEMYDNKLKVKLPTLKGFARYIDVAEPTLYEWDKKYPEFSKSLDKIRIEQHDRLVNMSLGNGYNSTIAKLMLSHNHGYREKSDMTTDGKELPQPIISIKRDDE